jgi:hypothetical protein
MTERKSGVPVDLPIPASRLGPEDVKLHHLQQQDTVLLVDGELR